MWCNKEINLIRVFSVKYWAIAIALYDSQQQDLILEPFELNPQFTVLWFARSFTWGRGGDNGNFGVPELNKTRDLRSWPSE